MTGTMDEIDSPVLNCFGSSEGRDCIHLLAQSSGHSRSSKRYWMHIAIDEDSKFDKLDALLRKVWMECCGHLSSFDIDGTRYACYFDEEFPDEVEMKKTVAGEVLREGIEFNYEYDYGSTTKVVLRVLGRMRVDIPPRKSAIVLARNHPPGAICECGNAAKLIIAEGMNDNNETLICLGCARDVDQNRTPLLPLLNSPRSGQCGYRGRPY